VQEKYSASRVESAREKKESYVTNGRRTDGHDTVATYTIYIYCVMVIVGYVGGACVSLGQDGRDERKNDTRERKTSSRCRRVNYILKSSRTRLLTAGEQTYASCWTSVQSPGIRGHRRFNVCALYSVKSSRRIIVRTPRTSE